MVPDVYRAVLRLPANTRGRDFVVGDVHGVLHLLEQALAAVHFDPHVDRLLMVGDLGDRGPHSAECLALLKQPWVHSVRGNHEQMALDAFCADGSAPTDARKLQWMRANGMDWWLQLSPAQRLPLLRLIERLPFAIEVQTTRGTVGIIHAEVPPGMAWQEFLTALEAGDATTMASCIWGRQRLEGRSEDGVPGVGRLFVGHTPQWGQLRRLDNIYAVDTGGVFGEQGAHPQGRLSLTNVVTRTAATAMPQRLPLLNVLDEPLPTMLPFGTGPAYATPSRGVFAAWGWPARR